MFRQQPLEKVAPNFKEQGLVQPFPKVVD